MAKIIRLSAPGASGATGGGSTPAALQLSAALPSGVIGESYSGALVASGGVPSYTFSISSGSLPAGLSPNAGTGAITGIPTTPGSYTFTGRVIDTASTTATVSCTIVVPNALAGEYIGSVSSVTAAEVANSVYQDTTGGLHMVVQVLPVLSASQYPLRCRVWIDYDDGAGWTLQGDRYASSSTPTFTFGDQTQQTGLTIAGTIWVPTDPAKVAWKAAVEANAMGPQPTAAAKTANFTVTPAQACPSTDVTNIHFVPNATTGDTIIYGLGDPGVWFYIWNLLEYTQPATSSTIAGGDPYFKSSFCTKQLGYGATGTGTVTGTTALQSTGGAAFASTDVGNLITVGTTLARIASFIDSTHVTLDRAVSNGSGQSYEVWRPAPASIFGDEGADDEDAIAQGYWGRKFTDGPTPSVLGSTVAQFSGTPSWSIPPLTLPDGSANPYLEMRIWVWAVSRLADNENGGTGTITLQNGWPSAANHGSLFPQQQSPALDLTRTKGDTLGRGLGLDPVHRKPQININGSTPLSVNGSNELYIPIAADFVVQTVGGVPTLTQQIVNLAKAVNFGTEFSNSGGIFIVNAIAVNKLIAGDALFAGQATFATTGGGKVIINSSGVTIQNKISSPTVTVALLSTGLSIIGPNGTLTADSTSLRIENGTSKVEVTASAVTIVNGSLTAPTITGGSMTITTGSGNTVSITGANAGILCSTASSTSQLSAGAMTITSTLGTTQILGPGILCGAVQTAVLQITSSLGIGVGMSSSTATAGSSSLPASPAGFIAATVNGVNCKIPYYNA